MSWKKYRDYKAYAQFIAESHNIKLIHQHETDQISFTPYIYNSCSASCKFCSEKLVRNGMAMICEEVAADYTKRLMDILAGLKDQEVFLSISGKEPSESCVFLENIMNCVGCFEEKGGKITEKVMYSNLSGFVQNMPKLEKILKSGKVTRIECSRHHYDEEINQSIMCFQESAIKQNKVLADIIRKLRSFIPVKMVCVLQKSGISSLEEVKKYIEFAGEMGISDLVFRELAMFDNSVEKGSTADYIMENRIELMDILTELAPEAFELVRIVEGYYYFSFQYRYQNKNVSFEMSDYEEMKRKHEGTKRYKLIYYPNGKLCTDWNMNGEISVREREWE